MMPTSLKRCRVMYCVVAGPEPARARVIPDYLEVSIGDTVEFRCDVTGGPPRTRIEWSRDVGDLPINAVMQDGVLRFQATSEDQQGRYECHVSTETGRTLASATSTLVIRVGMSSAIRTLRLRQSSPFYFCGYLSTNFNYIWYYFR